MRWKLDDWKPTIEKIVNETNQAARRSGKQKVLDDWRSKLEKEPTLLQAFQIDMIVREVRSRLKSDAK